MDDITKLLTEMRDSIKAGEHKKILARLDEEISFGNCSPILRAIFQFMMGKTPAQHRAEAQRLRAESSEHEKMAEFHEVFADMLE